jgi:hypothetical protein
MKQVISNKAKTMGLVLPDPKEVTTIGLFEISLIREQLDALSLYDKFDTDGLYVIEVSILDNGKGMKMLSMKPHGIESNAHVVVAPRIESD